MDRTISFRVYGDRALFSDPVTRVGGEKSSYHVPTYQALKGITESIYWKPTIVWKIEKCRVMNRIRTETSGIRPIRYTSNTNDLAYYTYLKDVCYEVVARLDWNEQRPDLKHDWNYNKHFSIVHRALEKGGRRDIFLGARECQAYVEPCVFGVEKGAYDDIEELDFGFMFHSFIYPDEAFDSESYDHLSVSFWKPVMKKGIIEFPERSELQFRRQIYEMKAKPFVENQNFECSGGE